MTPRLLFWLAYADPRASVVDDNLPRWGAAYMADFAGEAHGYFE